MKDKIAKDSTFCLSCGYRLRLTGSDPREKSGSRYRYFPIFNETNRREKQFKKNILLGFLDLDPDPGIL